MKRLTVIAGSLALLLSSVLYANESLSLGNFFVADESQHQWANENNGRVGLLEVHGALLSSPCILETNEIRLPLAVEIKAGVERYPLKLVLVGCGEGGLVTSASSTAGVASTMVVHSALLSGRSGGVLQPEQRVVGWGRASLHGGGNQLIYFLTAKQQQALANISEHSQRRALSSQALQSDMLRIRLDYE